MAMTRALAVAILCSVAVFALTRASAEDDVDLGKLRVKELKKMLDERGLECEGCVEKEHILSKVKESLHLPILTAEERAAREEAKNPKPKSDGGYDDIPKGGKWGAGGKDFTKDMEMQEILKKLNLGDRVKMFRPEDFMKYADDIDSRKQAFDKRQKTDTEAEL